MVGSSPETLSTHPFAAALIPDRHHPGSQQRPPIQRSRITQSQTIHLITQAQQCTQQNRLTGSLGSNQSSDATERNG
jgi:hypothetical protein